MFNVDQFLMYFPMVIILLVLLVLIVLPHINLSKAETFPGRYHEECFMCHKHKGQPCGNCVYNTKGENYVQ